MAKKKLFTGLSFLGTFPVQRVKEHQVLMSFQNDGDCEDWTEWWRREGSAAFQAWLEIRELRDSAVARGRDSEPIRDPVG